MWTTPFGQLKTDETKCKVKTILDDDNSCNNLDSDSFIRYDATISKVKPNNEINLYYMLKPVTVFRTAYSLRKVFTGFITAALIAW